MTIKTEYQEPGTIGEFMKDKTFVFSFWVENAFLKGHNIKFTYTHAVDSDGKRHLFIKDVRSSRLVKTIVLKNNNKLGLGDDQIVNEDVTLFFMFLCDENTNLKEQTEKKAEKYMKQLLEKMEEWRTR